MDYVNQMSDFKKCKTCVCETVKKCKKTLKALCCKDLSAVEKTVESVDNYLLK